MYCACHTHAHSTVASPSGLHLGCCFSRCGNIFFPLRRLFGLQSWTFSGAGFFPASREFFPPRTDFFPPRAVLSAASRMHFFCCKSTFLLLQGVFLAALIFPAVKRHFLLTFFPAAEAAFSAAGRFFLLPNSVPMFFPTANLCFSHARGWVTGGRYMTYLNFNVILEPVFGSQRVHCFRIL